MTIPTLTSRQVNQDAGGAKKAAERGPVIITDRGKPAHVLLGIQEYRRLIGSRRKIADLLAMPDVGDIELEIPQMREHARPADLSCCICSTHMSYPSCARRDREKIGRASVRERVCPSG